MSSWQPETRLAAVEEDMCEVVLGVNEESSGGHVLLTTTDTSATGPWPNSEALRHYVELDDTKITWELQ